jgi:hypothetical protein
VGGELLPRSFDDAVVDNSVADVPYLIGYTADDIRPWRMSSTALSMCATR